MRAKKRSRPGQEAAKKSAGEAPSQAEFARLFAEAMDILGVSGVYLAGRTGWHPTTISDYRNPKHRLLPKAPRRRILERELGLPEGYLDGVVDVDLHALRQARRPSPERLAVRENGARYLAGVEGREGEGWLWGEPSEGEEFMRTVLRNLERTTRAMVGKPDLFSAEDLRLNRLGTLRAAMHSHELAGKAVPTWLRALYDEVSDGRFR